MNQRSPFLFLYPKVETKPILSKSNSNKRDKICDTVKSTVKTMNNRKRGFVSVLMNKGLSNMETFEWLDNVSEVQNKIPVLFKIITSAIMPSTENPNDMIDLFPRLGMIYAILMQGKHSGLSLVQRIISMLLMDNICDQKVTIL